MKMTSFYVAVVAVFTCIGLAVSQECAAGWERHEDSCYYFTFHPQRSYQESARGCEEYGAHLLTVNTKEEMTFISDWLTKHDQGRVNKWWTSGHVRGDNIEWSGDGSNTLSSPEYWANLTTSHGGDVVVFAFSELVSAYRWDRERPESQCSQVCEISVMESYRITQRGRDFMYGTNITDPNEIRYGPQFFNEPKSTVVIGRVNEVVIECIARSNPPPTYKWFRKYRAELPAVVSPDKRYVITDGRLIITKPEANFDQGRYHCVASNELGAAISESAEISFGYLMEFSNDPQGIVIAKMYSGTNINCRLPAYSPAVNIRWYKEDGGPNFLRTDLHPHQFVSTNGKFYLSETSNQDAGYYHCVVTLIPKVGQILATNQPPSRTSLGIQLAITGDSPRDYGPEIHDDFPAVFPHPTLRGETLTIECFAYGKLPLYYSWKKDNGPLPNKAVISDHGRVVTLPDAQLEDAGNYTCRVERGSSGVAEKSLSLIVEAKPFFITPLRHHHIDMNCTFTWHCEAAGLPKPTYSWYKDGQVINSSSSHIQVRGNILKIDRADTVHHQGMYQCSASNVHGTTMSTAQIRVLSFKPSFARHPVNPSQMGTEGGTITMLCQPEAAPAPNITWYKNGMALPISFDANERLVQLYNGNLMIKELHISDKGIYECMAVNYLGAARSSGILTVVSQTVLTRAPSDTLATVNTTVFLECQASYDKRNKDLVYIWDMNGREINFDIDHHFKLGEQGEVTGLYIISVQTYHTGMYGCTAQTVDESIRKTAYLEVAGPPGECAGVVAVVNGNNALIKWVPGPTNSADITKFDIEFSTDFNKSWRMLKNDITFVEAVDRIRNDRCIYNVTGLKPGSSYRFRLVAYNRFGPGPPSLPSGFYKIQDAAPVTTVTAIRENFGPVGTLVVEWDLLNSEDLTGDNVGYRIYYRKKSYSNDTKWSQGEVSGHFNQFSALVGIENYYLEYEIKICAFNDHGPGPNSSVEIIMSQGDVPLAAATKVFVKPYNSTALKVFWTPVPLVREAIRGKMVGYGINYWLEGEGMDSSNAYCVEDCGYALLVGLEPRGHYWVNLQLYTMAGMGAPSEDYYQYTYHSAPLNYPEYVHVASYDSRSVRVMWRGITTGSNEEVLRGYKIKWWSATENIRTANETIIPNRQTFGVVHGIGPNTVYALRVMGFSRGGDGKNSPTVYFTLEGQVMYNPETTEILNCCPGCFSKLHVVILLIYCVSLTWH
ncbi:contactin-like [Physella acuta]|uniref:contactin-like n=1 Tax=Physella acuta TaxID=109671 RepID=UPI0027DC35C2|nr:contactin-like [Physella acuta]